ncbi:hypothetical protein CAEBREN_12036 [Caenorhabditis brenneri]|uniref:Uncharacterized protein n=1 Tax=Caenorhabditis brenneri TaxID=135651 RepID=G0MJ30_CAEBE|nr:hypothetical protein CAEBREN_12036 [Caenorhabditis brenneri]
MKFKSISIFISLIDLVHGGQGNLTVEENQRRLESCGKGDKEKEIGGVLEQTIDGKFTVIGIKTSGDWTRYGTHIFFRMEWLEDDICKLTGICTKGIVMPEPLSSTESATTSGSMETSGTPESSDPHEATTLDPSTAIAGTLETSVNPITSEGPGTSSEVATTVLPPAPVHRRTMPPEYEDHGDYDMIFDSLYEFPEFREIEETPYEKKGSQRCFELVFVVLFMLFVYEM